MPIFDPPKTGNFIKGETVRNGPLEVVIREVEEIDGKIFDKAGNDTGEIEVRPLLHFDGTDLILEVKPGNYNTLYKEYGPNSDAWLGKTIILKHEITGTNEWAKLEIKRETRRFTPTTEEDEAPPF